ncbi:MAG: DNA double-strand break repair nuclease NurA, partial [Armatimonadetes bacterium]|nr:DNA double-strand break repair nuclease NurA [Armatimonadota bacterium]MDW8029761.1 DNA double-strand break repair nuclease NurA [Armatimonadota bacterium]
EARPHLGNRPFLFYREGDLYQRWGGRKVLISEEIVSVRRHLMEVEELVRLARAWKFRPAVALLDGTLILWTLEGKPADFRAIMLRRFLKMLDILRDLKVPIAGYISAPGSTDVINALRVGLCGYEFANCDQCEWVREGKMPPCAVIEGVADIHLFERLLKPGERSSLFWSSSQILAEYGEHQIGFFYLNAGLEIARVEIPKWVAEDEDLLNLVHSVVYDQAQKGRGYPIALAEAHEQAVVRGSERELFYEMLESALIKQGFKVSMTFKLMAKRTPAV